MSVPPQPAPRVYTQRRMRAIKVLIVLFIVGGILWLVVPLQRMLAFTDTIIAEADTFIDGNEPNKGFGNATFMNVKHNPPAAALLRFDVIGVASNGPHDTHLQLFVLSSATQAAVMFTVFQVTNSWHEHDLTWNSQPAFGDQIGASNTAPVVAGQWVDINLGTAVQGDGLYSFALTTDAPDVVRFAAHTEPNAARLVFSPQELPIESPSTLPEETASPVSEATETLPETILTDAATERATDVTSSPDEATTNTPIDLTTISTHEPISSLTSDDTPDDNTIEEAIVTALPHYLLYMPVVSDEAPSIHMIPIRDRGRTK